METKSPYNQFRIALPTCKYGHGELKKEDGLWGLGGFDRYQLSVNSTVDTPINEVIRNERAFTLCVYRCSKCGYLEFFDDVIENG